MVGSNLVISFAEGSVTILNQTGSGKVENLKLSDGSILNLDDYAGWIVGTPGVDNLTGTADNQTIYGAASDDILNAYISGSSLAGGLGNDILNGNAGNDTLGGGAGNDTIFGGAGDDVYLFSPGDGFDVISDTSGFDTLSILDAITFSDLVFTKVGNDLQIDIASGVTITDFYSGDPNLILEQIQFSGGTSFDLTSLLVPVAQDDVFTADQDTIVTGNVLVDNGNGADSDSDGGILSVVAGTFATTNGSVTILSNGDFTYTPNAGYIGFDSFTYTLNDGQGNSDVGAANITLNFVAPPNTAPIAQDDAFSGNQDLDVTGNLLADNGNGVDSDPDGDAISTVAQTIVTTNGSVVIAANGDFTYTPNAGYTGTDSFSYTLQDSLGATDIALASITINASVNNNPVAVADVFAGNEDSVISGNVLTNDTDADNDTLSVTAATLTTANGGAVNLLADGSFTYTPAADFNGSDSFTYTVLDGQGANDIGTVTLNVAAVNDVPLAVDDSATTNEDTAITINVIGNDSDIDGDALNVTAVSGAVNGSAIINADNTITYTPNANFNGTETLAYTVDDGNGGATTANVNITIEPINDAPVAVGDSFTGNEDSVITGNVIANDSDIDGDVLSAVATTLTTTNGASVSILANGDFTYTPVANFNGADSFNYTLNDPSGLSSAATVSIDVLPVNDNPVAGADSFSISEDAVLSGNVLGNDSDIDGGVFSAVAATITTANGGAVNLLADGSFTYTPATDFNGADSFTYTVNDGQGGSDLGTASINVTPVNDNPIATDDSFSANQDSVITGNVLSNDTDADGDTLSVTPATITTVNGGTVALLADGAFTYTPATGFNGADSFSYTLLDGTGLSDIGTVNLDILSASIIGGTSGNDTLNGTSGDDLFDGQEGDDALNGAAGADIYYFSYGDGNDTITESADSSIDKIVFDASVTQAMIGITRTGNYEVTISIDNGLGGSITLNNQMVATSTLTEILEFSDGSTIDLTTLDYTYYGTTGNDSIFGVTIGGSGIDTIYGLDGNDTLYGYRGGYDTLANTLDGGNGNDVLHGSSGVDTMIGGAGNDTLNGNAGNDLLTGGTGDDALNGAAGADIYYFSYGDGNDTITESADSSIDKIVFDASVTQAMIGITRTGNYEVTISIDNGLGGSITLNNQMVATSTLTEILEFSDGSTIDLTTLDYTYYGTTGNDSIFGVTIGGSGIDTIYGLDGNDTLYGYRGGYDTLANTLDGGNGNDTIFGSNGVDTIIGGAGTDTLKGNGGDDIISGNDGSDYIYGGTGNDILSGGDGIDMIYGQGGADTFIFEALTAFNASDNIQDFNLSENDKFDISDLLQGYDATTDAITDFVQITETGTDSYLSVDADGGADNFVQVAYIYNETGLTDEDALLTSGNLIAA